jgi:hypothetical protein
MERIDCFLLTAAHKVGTAVASLQLSICHYGKLSTREVEFWLMGGGTDAHLNEHGVGQHQLGPRNAGLVRKVSCL